MPIEILWYFAKKIFRRECITLTDYKKNKDIQNLVEQSILRVNPEHVHSYTNKVINMMRNFVEKNN